MSFLNICFLILNLLCSKFFIAALPQTGVKQTLTIYLYFPSLLASILISSLPLFLSSFFTMFPQKLP